MPPGTAANIVAAAGCATVEHLHRSRWEGARSHPYKLRRLHSSSGSSLPMRLLQGECGRCEGRREEHVLGPPCLLRRSDGGGRPQGALASGVESRTPVCRLGRRPLTCRCGACAWCRPACACTASDPARPCLRTPRRTLPAGWPSTALSQPPGWGDAGRARGHPLLPGYSRCRMGQQRC